MTPHNGARKSLLRSGSAYSSDELPNAHAPSFASSSSSDDDRGWVLNGPNDAEEAAFALTYIIRTVAVSQVDFQKLSELPGSRVAHSLRSFFSMPKPLLTEPCEGTARSSIEEALKPTPPDDAAAPAPRCVLPPTHALAHWWTVTMLALDCTYVAFLVPISVAFSIPNAHLSTQWVAVLDIIAGLMILSDIVINFRTAFFATNGLRRALVTHPRAIARYYLKHGSFAVDAVSLVPFPYTLVVGTLQLHHAVDVSPELVSVIQALRLVRFVRVARVVRFAYLVSRECSNAPARVLRFLSSGAGLLLQLFYGLAILINLLGCMMCFVANRQGLEDSWLSEVRGEDLSDSPARIQWFLGVYWALTAVTTIGFGEITPATNAERAVTMLMEVVGVAMFATIMGAITAAISRVGEESSERQELRKQRQALETMMRRRHFPAWLCNRIRLYHQGLVARAHGGSVREDTLLAQLPKALRSDIAEVVGRDLLPRADALSDLPARILRAVAGTLEPLVVMPGDDLCCEGDQCGSMYLLQEGEAAVVRGGKVVEMVSAPAVLGEFALLDAVTDGCGAARPQGYRAAATCTVWELCVATLRETLEGDAAAMLSVVRRMRRFVESRIHGVPECLPALRSLRERESLLTEVSGSTVRSQSVHAARSDATLTPQSDPRTGPTDKVSGDSCA
ncbi:unnamed protein product [Pedinophyceae sp. YPF-701]|nr:unnamed protein product [Pedinophyceae sp. YPF-701]